MKILDHGSITLVESWGSDELIIEAARMSTNKGFQGWGSDGTTGDEKLLRYLYEHKHSTPFEMAGLIVEVKAPIFVFRQWHRHRTASYNEMSARYTPLPDQDFMPTIKRILTVDGKNKQANGTGKQIDETAATKWLESLNFLQRCAESTYQEGLKMGVPKEIARVALTNARYSQMRASMNLRGWLGFITLRSASDAQKEIQDYSNAVGELIAELFPRTWEIFEDNR